MSYPTNGYGERIYNPEAYDRAVAEDRYGYNSYNQDWNNDYSDGWYQYNENKRKEFYMSYYRNGYGERIHNPEAYHRAVSEDRYGYSSYNSGWHDGYSCGYSDGYADGSGTW